MTLTIKILAFIAAFVFSFHSMANDNDWSWYHGNDNATRYSALEQINTSNIDNLNVAWIHHAGNIKQGLEATPLVIDGIMYYSGSYNRTFALDAATGKEIWHYYPDLDPLVEDVFFTPYSRGVAVNNGMVHIATIDGRAIALDQKTGKEVWSSTLVDIATCSCNFTSPAVLAGDTLILGQTAGEYPIQGKIFGLDPNTGETKWALNTIKDDPNSWGGDSGTYGGGGSWMPGTYDASTDTYFVGTSNPAPDYDWGASPDGIATSGARPGDNLYTSSVLALDPGTGKIKWYHQEIPHDDWDYDSALGEFMLLDRDNKQLVVHQNKSGYVFVYNRGDGQIENIWNMVENFNWVEGINPKTGELIGRNPPNMINVDGELVASDFVLCPWIGGGRSWNSGSYSPKTGLWYNSAAEACQTTTVRVEEPVTEPAAQLFFGADLASAHLPNGKKAHGRLDARDPVSGKRAWAYTYKYPPLHGVLSTAGDLVFQGQVDGMLRAFNANSGDVLWSFNAGSGFRNGGAISYSAKGKQYIATGSGIGSLVWGLYPGVFPETADFPAGAAMIGFTVN
ncbi:MAG: PQQ-binding-like beta-propeller repeat protein [Alphaproteobacteria bacterium]|jgi:alcohol dehydrogenase (cytochrome c)